MFLLREHLIFDKIYEKLNINDKRNVKTAFEDDAVVAENIKRHDQRNMELICPACVIDTETDKIPWSEDTTAFNRRQLQRIIDTKFPNENLVLRTSLKFWDTISPHQNYDGDKQVMCLQKSTDFESYGELPIRNTDSKIGSIGAGDGKTMYDKIFGGKQWRKFTSIEALNAHFISSHCQNADNPMPERFFRAYNRGQQEMELRTWPMWDYPLHWDSQYRFPVWHELRENLFYIKKAVTENIDLLSNRNDWNTERLLIVIRHKTFRSYQLLMTNIPPLTRKSKNLSYGESQKLFHITALFFLFEQKIVKQSVYNINLNSIQIKNFANILLLYNFFNDYFTIEFGQAFPAFIGWEK